MACARIDELMILEEYTTGKPIACDIQKIKRLKEEK